MGHPERNLSHVVQVVGTNGKGTTAVALATALTEMGYPSGVFLSPHVLSYTERVVLQGRPVSEEEFADAMGETIDLADKHGIPVSQFEILTAGALKMFADAGLSWAVLEAGLGARYDATSVARADAVVLTNVALDHTEYLGETVEEIAEEKLASLTQGATLFLGTDEEWLVELARSACRRLGSELVEFAGDNASYQGVAPYGGRNLDLGLAVAGRLLETEIAIRVRERLMAGEVLPGRFDAREVEGVPVVLDGGHNAAGVSAALEAMRGSYAGRPLGVVFGVLQEKDAAGMLSGFMNRADIIVLTRPESERASDPYLLERDHDPHDRGGRRAMVVPDPLQALAAAVDEMKEVDGVVLVTGSLSTVAPVLRWLHET